jgi:FMN phosphatase YigB (HAD superfamily)
VIPLYKNVLFDLDGTLLPMDLRRFVELYVAAFCKQMVPVTQLDAKTLMDAIWTSVARMAENDGNCLNEDVFLAHHEPCLRQGYARLFRTDR